MHTQLQSETIPHNAIALTPLPDALDPFREQSRVRKVSLYVALAALLQKKVFAASAKPGKRYQD